MAAEQACAYAALLLHDSGVEVNGANIQKILAAAKIQSRETVPILFGQHFETVSMQSLIDRGASAPAAAPVAASAAPAAGAKKEEKKKEEEKEEGDDDMGFGLFD
jgi:ribosomal protein L12E/L44/L45/RPP1/RPP2